MTTVFKIDLGITEEETYSITNKSIKFDSLEDIKPFLDELETKSGLKKIDISGNTISPLCSKLLCAKLMPFKETLVDLNLQDIYTSRDKNEIPASLAEFFPIIFQSPNLRVLNLSDNAFGQDAISTLEELVSKCKSVEHLILSNNGLGPLSGARIGAALYKLSVLKASDSNATSLKTFWCGRNRLENGSINHLVLGLKSNSDLEEIKLYQNGIRPRGIATLITYGLVSLAKLKCLDLQDNTFTLAGATALANGLSSWTELTELNINDCLLKSQGCLKFISKLGEISGKSKLEVIKLQYNELESDSLEILVRYLPSLKSLKSLELNGNRFEEDSELIDKINEIFGDQGFGELDELDDLEEPDSDEEDEEDEDEDENEEDEDADKDEELAKLEKELAATTI